MTIFHQPKDMLDMVGSSLGNSEWVKITQDRINMFADATDDHQWIHVDEEKAKAGPYACTIAHGYLTLSLVNRFLPKLLEVHNFSSAVNYGCNKVRFPAPLKVATNIRCVAQLVGAEEVKGGVQAVVNAAVEMEGLEKPACVAEVIARYFY